MLEILFVIFLWRKLGDNLESKGYMSTILMKLFLVVSWIAGELIGAVVGVFLSGGESGLMAYVGALIGAFAGAGVVFLIAKLMPVKTHEIQALVKDRPQAFEGRMQPAEQQQVSNFEPPVPGQAQSPEPLAPLEFPCPQCHNAIAWIEEYAGSEMTCPHCATALVVPQQA